MRTPSPNFGKYGGLRSFGACIKQAAVIKSAHSVNDIYLVSGPVPKNPYTVNALFLIQETDSVTDLICVKQFHLRKVSKFFSNFAL
jgi:hypothetical protein